MGGLGFIVPAFLAGIAALVVPIVLHLRHREKDKPQKFPSLMFLEQLPIRTAERRRITDWPLLLIRALALSLLVLAFARPVFSGSAAAERSKRARSVILMVDRSMSMGRTRVFTTALDSARKVVASLSPADRVAIVFFDDEAEVALSLTPDKSAALAVLDKAQPTHRGTKYAAALRAARQLVGRAGETRSEVVVITDLQRSGVQGVAGLDMPANIQLRTIAVGAKDLANITVSSVDIQRNTEALRAALSVQARIISREGTQPKTIHATLSLNGRTAGTRDAVIPASGSIVVPFPAVLLPSGWVRGAITIDHDALAADDTFNFAFTADDALHILLVAPDDVSETETAFFERALAVGKTPLIRIQRVRAGQISARDLAKTSLVVLWDTPASTGGKSLAEWVHGGGGLVVLPGRRAAARVSPGPLFPATIDGAVERLADRGGTFGEIRLDHPLFAPFREASAALSAARFLRYPHLSSEKTSEVLARFDDGNPAVIEHRQGLGRILIVAAALDARSGDFPLQSAYLPFLQRLALYSSGRDVTRLARAAGESWLLPGALEDPAVLTPSGSIVRPTRDSVGSTVALRDAGVYSLYERRVQGEPASLVAVNAPAVESDLTTVDEKELLLGVRQVSDSAVQAYDQPTRVEVESRQRIWRLLVAAAALLLLGETIFGNRGWRGTANRIMISQAQERGT